MDPSMNNSFGGSEREVISSGGGDVYLPVNPKNSSDGKKWLLIFGAIFVVIAIGLGIAAAVMGGSGQSGGGENISYKEAFNRYANYFLEGDQGERDINLSEYNIENSYFLKTIDSNESKTEYLNNLKQYYEVFYDLIYDKAKDSEAIISLLNENRNQINLLSLYYDNGFLARNDIIEAYSEEGDEGAKKIIDEAVLKYDSVENIYELSFKNLMQDWGNKTLQLVKEYEKAGCLRDGMVDYTCASQDVNETAQMLGADISNDYTNARMIINNSIKDLFWNLLSFDSLVYDEGGADE